MKQSPPFRIVQCSTADRVTRPARRSNKALCKKPAATPKDDGGPFCLGLVPMDQKPKLSVAIKVRGGLSCA